MLLWVLLYWGLGLAFREMLALFPALAGSHWGMFFAASFVTFLAVWDGLRLCLLLGLYRRAETVMN